MEIRALRPDDVRSSFDSGSPDLDRFFRLYSGQNQFRHHIGTTYVAVDKDRILGFATVSAAHVDLEDVPRAMRGKLPRYPLPVLRLARLAVDRAARGLGLGKALVRYVLRIALRMADEVGCVGVVVDAKPEAEPFYEGLGFAVFEIEQGRSEERPRPTAMFLSTRQIRDALA